MTTNNTADRSSFRRAVRVATLSKEYTGARQDASVFVFVEWDGSKLSLSGVEGPKANGDALGGVGQIGMGRERHQDRAPFYDRLAEVWAHWHLHNMRPGCEHQRAEGWGLGNQVEVVTYQLTGEALSEAARITGRAVRKLESGEPVQYTPEELEIMRLPFRITQAPDADGPGAGRYEVKSREWKSLAWLRPDEHPEGVLGKPCPVCGYKYGTEWKREEVPNSVLDFLRALPDASDAIPTTWLRQA